MNDTEMMNELARQFAEKLRLPAPENLDFVTSTDPRARFCVELAEIANRFYVGYIPEYPYQQP